MSNRPSAKTSTTGDGSCEASAVAHVRSFAPLLGEAPRVLILGSMPGIASLDAHAYYAHPRNAFWPILIGWLDSGIPDRERALAIPYDQRCERLTNARIALWDVLDSCKRTGSLDSAIVRSSERVNDLSGLIAGAPTIERIVFNGRAAEKAFARHVRIDDNGPERIAAPSTSPAMAAMDLATKHRAWCQALDTGER